MRPHKKGGYALVITIVITLVLSITALTAMAVEFSYTSTIKTRKQNLKDNVKDGGESAVCALTYSDDSVTHYTLYT